MVLLADKASDDGTGIFASKQTMADELCCSKQTVIDTIKAFMDEGLVLKLGERRNANGYTVEYGINVEALEAVALVKCHADRQSSKLTGQPAGPVNKAYPTGQPAGPKPSMNPLSSEAEASSDKRARKPDPFPCPAGVDEIDWDGLKANRKAKRAALTEGAHRQILSKLDRWQRDGWPPGPIVATAVERGWTTVFETDEMKAGKDGRLERLGTQTRQHGSIERAAREALEIVSVQRRDREASGQARSTLARSGDGRTIALPSPHGSGRYERH